MNEGPSRGRGKCLSAGCTYYGWQVIHAAVGRRRTAALSALLQAPATALRSVLALANTNGRTTLAVAVELQEPSATLLLLRSMLAVGVAVSAGDGLGLGRWAALAQPEGWEEMLRLLLEPNPPATSAGTKHAVADVDSQRSDGGAAAWLCRGTDGRESLPHTIAAVGTPKAVQTVLTLCGAPCTPPHPGGFAGLWRRLWGGRIEDRGGLLGLRDGQGATVLHRAAAAGRHDNVALLLEECVAPTLKLRWPSDMSTSVGIFCMIGV